MKNTYEMFYDVYGNAGKPKGAEISWKESVQVMRVRKIPEKIRGAKRNCFQATAVYFFSSSSLKFSTTFRKNEKKF